MLASVLILFFSSRRRHTRSKRDWSSDVCSSDLSRNRASHPVSPDCPCSAGELAAAARIGRASCRERVEIAVVAGSLKKKSLGRGVQYELSTVIREMRYTCALYE